MNKKNTWAVVIGAPNLADPHWDGVRITEPHSISVWDRNGHNQYDTKGEAEKRAIQMLPHTHYHLSVEKYSPRKYDGCGRNAPKKQP